MIRERRIKSNRPINQNPAWQEIAGEVTGKELEEKHFLTEDELTLDHWKGIAKGIANVAAERLFWARFWCALCFLLIALNLAWMWFK